ncbi:hypothetical protein M514_08390 [Trichuris suis]|uniref:Uncharacterized protein n=1 Tax=Trichuris suis TaxID=68888 RepID=A0A085M0I8_9BILA|nr:hypothetical protein M513_08390 [Trichuris suis]KFD63160.1 hypothetical protein M514_08390 [Trichuris suis]
MKDGACMLTGNVRPCGWINMRDRKAFLNSTFKKAHFVRLWCARGITYYSFPKLDETITAEVYDPEPTTATEKLLKE